jgi:hypothetical protein
VATPDGRTFAAVEVTGFVAVVLVAVVLGALAPPVEARANGVAVARALRPVTRVSTTVAVFDPIRM